MVHRSLDVCAPTDRSGIHFNKAYIQSIASINKAVEFMLFMFSFALASNFKSELVSISRVSRIYLEYRLLDFHVLIMVFGWVGVITSYLFYLFNVANVVQKKFRRIYIVLTIVYIIGALIILISTGLILDDVITIRKLKACRYLEGCPSYEGAGATSFFSVISVSFDAVLHGLKAYQVHITSQPEETYTVEVQHERPDIVEGVGPENPDV